MESDRVLDGDDVDYTCPLCVEEFDIHDRNFKPCPCGYQVCPFCWNHIRNNLNGLCPACRRPYSDQPEWKPTAVEEYSPHPRAGKLTVRSLKQEQLRTAKKKDKKHHQPDTPSNVSVRKTEPVDSRKHLQGMRVTQKNLVYVIGLSLKLITDEALALLRGQEYFGQYGKIQKIMINKRKDIPPLRGGTFDKSGSSVSVYVTFQRKEDATKCIAALDGATVDGNTLRAAYGTTKYCTAFLQHRQCQNPNCMYLHSEQDQDDTESHTREEAVNIQHAAKLGQNPAPKTPAKPLLAEDRPERPILPTSVSWAKAAVGARAHSPTQERVQQVQDQRRQSIPPSLPSQPSPVSTPEPPRLTSPAMVENSSIDLISPSDISLSLATSDQRSRIAMRLFDKILENFQKGSFKFGISTDLLESDDFKLATQASPYFQFKKDSELSEASDVESSKGSESKQAEPTYSPKPRGFDPFASTLENGTSHKRVQSRFAYVNDPISKALAQPIPSTGPQSQLTRTFSPPRMSDQALLTQHIPSTHAASQFKTATPPPPGMYFSHVQQYDIQRRQQQLLEQQRMQNYPDYGYYPQQVPTTSSSRNYTTYDEQDHGSMYAPQARRLLLDNQGGHPGVRRDLRVDSLQDLSGSLMNMRMSPHLPQGFGAQQPPLPQAYGGQQGGFVGRRYMGSTFQ